MAKLPPPVDPTLAAVDAAIESIENGRPAREYLGMSGIGRECERQIWYDWRWVSKIRHSALSLKRFADGHHGEDLQAKRLRLVNGITLVTVDPDNGRQISFEDLNGHFRGHADGAIVGLLQAPKTWHIWEHKQVEEKKQNKLAKLIVEAGEKQALEKWDTTYYAQAMLYLHYSGMERHYLTCSTPGGRHTISVRSDPNLVVAQRLIAKAEAIINAPSPPAKLSDDPDYFICRFCDFKDVCHGEERAERNCRTCLHASPVANGKWHCAARDIFLSPRNQRAGCMNTHRYVPDLVAGEQTDVRGDAVVYRMRDGAEWVDAGC